MIQKIRMKFTFAAVTSMALVLLVILGIINVMNYSRVTRDADEVLEILKENGGVFPLPPMMDRALPKDGEIIGKKGGRDRPISPETPYETRYFTVSFDGEGQVKKTETRRIAAVDEKSAQAYAKEVLKNKKTKGYIEDFRYIIVQAEDGTQIIFLDCGRVLSGFRGFLTMSIVVSAVGIFAVFLLLMVVSKWVAGPYMESYEKQRQFITDAGHEIKTPLTIIDADAEIIAMELGEENEWVMDIQKQIVRLKDLTNDLIYLSKMEEVQKEMQKISFPLSEVATEAVQSFQAPARLEHKDFQWEIEPMISYGGEMKSIQRLFSILLDNALKYSDEEGTIRFSLKNRKKNIEITVYNTVAHIEKEQIQQIFERFYRGDSSRSSETSGYGIGLSIAKAIVNAHRGKITAFTEDEKSLTIQVLL